MLLFNLLPFGSICLLFVVVVFFFGGGGFIATFFRLALPLCGDLNVLVM